MSTTDKVRELAESIVASATVFIPRTCGSCRHWSTELETRCNEEWRTCQKVTHLMSWFINPERIAEAKEDDDVEFLQDREEAIGDRKAVVLDGSNFLGALKCQDDFGCVHYEPKGEPERR